MSDVVEELLVLGFTTRDYVERKSPGTLDGLGLVRYDTDFEKGCKGLRPSVR